MSQLAATCFGEYTHPEARRPWQLMVAANGWMVVDDGDDIVGMACYLDLQLTVPGGVPLPAAGVSAVAVAPTHRRRGVLRAMYDELHDRVARAGYPIAALTASEGGIYGRFGYGPATIERGLAVQRRFAEIHADVPDTGQVRLVQPREHREQFLDIYERWRRVTPGGLACPETLWDDVLLDRDSDRGGASAWFGLLHPDGFAMYRVRHGETSTARVEAMRVLTPEAHAALWRVLLGLDLMDQVLIDTHPGDPLPYLLVDTRQAKTTSQVDALWLRIMDVPACLTARRYRADISVVLDVVDQFRSDGGRFALDVRDGVAQCVPTDAPADLQLNTDVLGSLYLGVHSASDLAAAHRIRYRNRDLLQRADLAFRGEVPAALGFHF